MTWEIYSFWDTQMFYNVLRGVALFFNNSSFYDLLIIGVTVGTVFAMIASMLGKNTPIEVLRHVLVGAILFYILVIPRTTVTVIDKSFLTQTSAPMTLSDIPTSLAFLAHTTSKFAVWIDEVYTTYFTSPAELVEAGSHMTRKIMLETALATPESAIFQHNMTEYTRECVVYDLNSGYKTMDSIRNASDTWQALGDTNPAVLVTLMKETMPGSSTYTNQVMSCPEAFTLLTDAKDELASELETRLSKKTFPGMNEVAAKLAYSGVVTSSMPAFMMDTTRTMSEHFQNSVTQNVFMKSLGEISGEPTSMARAMIGVDAGSDQKAELAKSFTYFLTIVQLLVYAFFPIAVMMVIFSGANGLKPLLMIVKVMVWIALVPATQIVLDEMILQNAINEASVVVDGYGAASINAWLQTGGIINGMEDQLQNALFASLALSWGMVSLVGFSCLAVLKPTMSGQPQTWPPKVKMPLAIHDGIMQTLIMLALVGMKLPQQ
jgi:conjugal transfer mating pair stabilization protein TraG